MLLVAYGGYLSQLSVGDEPTGERSGTSACEPHATAGDASATPAAGPAECESPGRGGKPGEAPKNDD